jgi:short-subunit dehydrogenase
MRQYAGKTALVTGASSGIGEAFARRLAAGGADVLLTSLPAERERLEVIAAELAEQHSVRAGAVVADLAESGAPADLQAQVDELDYDPDILVNSAGIGVSGRFVSTPLEQQLRMIRVNVEALVALTGLYLPRMAARRTGAVVNVGSTAALQPMPYFGVYAASKAFVQSFGEALWAEYRRTGVRVITVCTGPVDTPFHGNGDAPTGVRRFIKRRYLTPDLVAASALDAVERDQPTVVLRLPGARLVLLPATAAANVVPRRGRLMASERVTRWLLDQQR